MSAPTFTFWAELDRGDDTVEVEVTYTCTPFVDATYWQPAEGGEVEIEAITLDGKPIDVTGAEEAKLYRMAEDASGDDWSEHLCEIAEYKAEQRADDRMMERWERGA